LSHAGPKNATAARHSTLLGSGLDAFPYRVQVTIR
jgi:hypothetical protein